MATVVKVSISIERAANGFIVKKDKHILVYRTVSEMINELIIDGLEKKIESILDARNGLIPMLSFELESFENIKTKSDSDE